ncbi:MAG: protein kinase, partial [Planctomycetaceae bacterium]|nr:protein kinase [Planctomycetaceae bacterium]
MLTCPHCKQSLTEPDLARQLCPHCGQRVLSGQSTIDLSTGHLTIELAPNVPVKGVIAKGTSTVNMEKSVTIVGDVCATIDVTDRPAAAGDPRVTRTLESTDLPSGDIGYSQTVAHDSSSGSHAAHAQTTDSSVALDQPGSGPSQSGSAHGSSQDDVERRLRQVWGSQIGSSRPQMTMRGGSGAPEVQNEREEHEERTTLIIRERALRRRSDAAPSSLIDYDLLDVLGEGGMGVVYSARQASIDREVAVKMLKADMSTSPSQRRKFLSEAAVTGELDHPNIVPIYDLGQNADGALFYSMKKVTGTPWSEVIKQKSLLDNLTILMKVADAVAFAHARGVVHRDLKPENVMLGDFGEVLVLDWGLAVATEGHRPTPNVSTAFNIAGTPAYMAPELAFGPMEAIGTHSDVYLLGAILYECITGRPPHAGRNARDCLKAAARNQIVPTEKRGELVEIALKAMETEPRKRYRTVQALQEAIRDYQAHSESIALCERAEAGLDQAATSGDYRDYSRALFAFEEALELWPGNTHAKSGVSRAKLQYATRALDKSDFDLGLSLVDAHDATHDAVIHQLAEAKSERDARQHRLARARRMMAGLAAAVFLAVSVGVCVASYLAYLAKESEKRAVASAKIAKENEDQAKVSETKAKTNADIANRERDRARNAEDEAKARREEAVASAYTALVAMAAARIDESAFDQARQALDQCDAKHRGWEWRRLAHVVEQGDVTQLPLPSRAEALAVSISGNLIATGSLDGIVRLWDNARRAMVAERNLGANTARITALAFHPQDDRWLVAGLSSGPQPLVAWNRETGELRCPAEEHRHADGVVQATFAADGKSLLTASHDRTARLWNWETLVPRVFTGHTGTVWSAALSADGKKVATASEDGTVRIWDAATRVQEQSASGQRIPFTQHQGAVHAVLFLPDPATTLPPAQRSAAAAIVGKPTYFLASAGYDKRVLLWQTDELVPFDFQRLVTDQPVSETAYQALVGHSAAIRSLALSSDGSRLASSATDHTIRIWQVRESGVARRGTLVKELRGHAGPVYAAVFNPGDPNAVVSTGYDDRVRLWSIDQYEEERTMPGLALRGHASAVLSARYSPNGESIVTASLDRTARTWNSKTAAQERLFREGHAYLASRAVFFP